ncbi:hypothetical protein PVA45_06200 [Entomospira entomophila]|nr:hypothetical protein [Entomospira entomophilus]WDI35298.1 hypothetical protein PVA45_06200 [Entomospira entomophilus]
MNLDDFDDDLDEEFIPFSEEWEELDDEEQNFDDEEDFDEFND